MGFGGSMSEKKVVYIAGPYRSKDGIWYIKENIRKAELAALEVWNFGGVALCPHKNTAFFDGAVGIPDETWLQGDLELLSRCDAVYAIEGWERSAGARAEVECAQELEMPVYFFVQQIHEYLKND